MPAPGRLFMAALAVLAGACAAPTVPAAVAGGRCADADRAADELTEERASSALLCLVRAHRRAAGRGALRADDRLATAASRHSADMVRRRYFGHVSPGGADLADRLRRSGALGGSTPRRFAEVLGWGTVSAGSPRRLVRAWLDSPPHRAILLDPRYDEAGVGVADGAPVAIRAAALTATMVLAG